MTHLRDNHGILRACASLVSPGLLVAEEERLLEGVTPLSAAEAHDVKSSIAKGQDVLGDAYSQVNSPDERRPLGQTYTPAFIVDSMVAAAKEMRMPDRVVDAGCGSGRFAIACALAFPHAKIIAVDSSPMATLMCKASACAMGLEDGIEVLLGDFTTIDLPDCRAGGSTLWIGNPPYVRHHDISAESKRWLSHKAAELGYKASGLSGLHAYFVLSIASRLQENDFGVLVTSAEWLDVKYGSLIRGLLVDRLGLSSLTVYDKSERVFKDAHATAAVFAFDARLAKIGDRTIALSSMGESDSSRSFSAGDFAGCEKWSTLGTAAQKERVPEGYVRLGDFARVHRGIVTGANKFWIRGADSGPVEKFTIPVVSHAREIMTDSPTVEAEGLSRLVVLPESLDGLSEEDARFIRAFIEEGERLDIDKGYVAKSRKCWWSIPIGEPATILMTYMARRPPKFVANPNKVRSLNVVHGIYPKIRLSDRAVLELVAYLNVSVSREAGRTYCGGLTKFEPKEVESIWVPSPEMLEEGSWRS